MAEAAAGIRRVVDGHMADTLREVTIGRGYDPRDFVIFAYGGAGPAHCAGFGAERQEPGRRHISVEREFTLNHSSR